MQAAPSGPSRILRLHGADRNAPGLPEFAESVDSAFGTIFLHPPFRNLPPFAASCTVIYSIPSLPVTSIFAR